MVEIVHPVGDGEFVCSGSLVAPNLVLTARHCVSETPDVGFSCDESGDGTDGGSIGPDYDPSTVYVFAGLTAPNELTQPNATAVRFFHDDATNVCDHDLALIELSAPIDGVAVATLDLDDAVKSGEVVTAVGWGVTSDGFAPNVLQQLPGVAVLDVGPASSSAGYDVGPDEFDVGQSICEGDSGGPALDSANAIIGVVSRGGNGVDDASTPQATCLGASTVNVYTETAPFRDVILAAFATVGATPALVGVKMGEPCTDSSECASGLCAAVTADAGLTCTEDCAKTACPGGFRCDVTKTSSLCTPAPGGGGCAVGASEEAEKPENGAWLVPVAAAAILGFAARRSRVGRRLRL